VSAQQSALVVIDMQNVFADPSSSWATPGFAAITPVVAGLVSRFSPQVVFTRFVAAAKPSGAWADYYRLWPFALQPPEAPLWDIVPELSDSAEPTGTHPVVDRPSFGKWGAALQAAVAPASSLLLCGVSTDCCVISTALAAADDGIRVQVVADACAGLSQADHQRALDAMALYAPLITITTSDALP
jgi:nicotinamidase-related amidase